LKEPKPESCYFKKIDPIFTTAQAIVTDILCGAKMGVESAVQLLGELDVPRMPVFGSIPKNFGSQKFISPFFILC